MKLSDFNYRHFILTRRYLILAVAMAVVSVVLIFGVGLTQLQAIFAMQSSLNKERKSLTELQKKATALQQAETLQLVDQAQKIDAALPSKKPLIEFLSAISQSASVNEVAVVDIQISPGAISTQSATASNTTTTPTSGRTRAAAPVKSAGPYSKLDLNLTVEGSLANINAFLDTMENTVPITNLTKISLNEKRSRVRVSEVAFSAEITLTSYYFNQSVKQAVEAPLPALNESAQNFLTNLNGFTFPTTLTPQTISGGGNIDLFGISAEELTQ